MDCYKETYYADYEDKYLIGIKYLINKFINTETYTAPAIGINKNVRYETDGKTIHYTGDICDIDFVLFYEYNNHTLNYKGILENRFFNGLDDEKKLEYLAISYLNNFGNAGMGKAQNYEWYFFKNNKAIKFDMSKIMRDIIRGEEDAVD